MYVCRYIRVKTYVRKYKHAHFLKPQNQDATWVGICLCSLRSAAACSRAAR